MDVYIVFINVNPIVSVWSLPRGTALDLQA